MRVVLRMSTVFLSFCAERYNQSVNDLRVNYPDSKWSTLSWSFWLMMDLQMFLLNRMEKPRIFKNFFSFKLDRFSFHFDFSRKMYLYSLLRSYPDKDKILIPEVGPCGFDVLIALAAGFKSISVYDVDQNYLDCCRNIWEEKISDYLLSDSNDFPLQDYLNRGYCIILPDWFHGQFGSHPNVIVARKDEGFKGHMKLINEEIVADFFIKVSNM